MLQDLIGHTGHKVEASVACASALSVEMATKYFLDNPFDSCSVFYSAEDAIMVAAGTGGDFRRERVKKHLSTLIVMQGLKILRPFACFSVSFDLFFFFVQ